MNQDPDPITRAATAEMIAAGDQGSKHISVSA